MLTLEKEIEKKFVKWIKDKGGIIVKFSDPSKKGAPDRIVLRRFEYTFFVEFKKPKGKLAEHQKAYAEELEALGFTVYLIDSHEAFEEFTRPSRSLKKFRLLDVI